MRFLFLLPPVALLCALCTVAQNEDLGSLWHFPFRVTLANGEGNSNPNRPTSFVDKTSLNIDLAEPFTMLGWFDVADRKFWRTAMSIESPDASGALFRIELPPDQMNFNIAWMRNANSRGGAINTTAIAPGPNVQFHFALVKTNRDLTIYIDGVRRAHHSFDNQIFNPPNVKFVSVVFDDLIGMNDFYCCSKKQIVLGRTKLDGNTNRSQWNGIIRDVYIYDEALTREQILQEREETMREE